MTNEIRGRSASEIIKKILLEERINQNELAKKVGVSRQRVSQILNKGSIDMRYDTFAKLSEALDYEIVVRKNGNKHVNTN